MLKGDDVHEFVFGEALYIASSGITAAATAEVVGVRPVSDNARIVKRVHVAVYKHIPFSTIPLSCVWMDPNTGLRLASCTHHCWTSPHMPSSMDTGRGGRSRLSTTLRANARSGRSPNGTSPVYSSQVSSAKLYTSTGLSRGSASRSSGAIHRSVPDAFFVRVVADAI